MDAHPTTPSNLIEYFQIYNMNRVFLQDQWKVIN